MTKFIFTVLLVLLFHLVSFAQWVHTSGPEGGDGRGIIAFKGKLFAAMDSGVYISSDNAASWQRSGLKASPITHICGAGKTLYATTTYAVYRSSDEGSSWQKVKNYLPIGSMVAHDTMVIAAVTGSDADYSGIYRLTSDTCYRISKLYDVTSLATIGTYTFATSNNYDIWRSPDAGLHWDSIPRVLQPGEYPYILLASNDTLYVTGSGCFMFTADNGNTWVTYPTPPYIFSTLGKAGSRLYAYLSSGGPPSIYSDNNGDVWYPYTPKSLPKSLPVSAYSRCGSAFYQQNANGIFRLESDGSWTNTSRGIPHLASRLGYSYNGSLNIFGPNGMFSTSNGGDSWVLAELPDTLRWTKFISHAIFKGRVYIDELTRYAMYDPATNVWTPYDAIYIPGLAVLPGMLFKLLDIYIYYITSDGLQWTADIIPPGFTPQGIYSTGTSVIMCGRGEFLDTLEFYRRTESSATWSKVYAEYYRKEIKAFAAHKGVLYATSGSRLLRSDNDGLSWMYDPIFDTNTVINALYSSGDYLFCAVDNSNTSQPGLLARSDNSSKFTYFGEGLPNINSLVLHSDGYLYAAGDGVWKRPLTELGIAADVPRSEIATLRPNPAHDLIIAEDDATMRLYSPTGAEVFSQRVVKGEHVILPKLASGVYIAKIETKSGVKSAKVVVQ